MSTNKGVKVMKWENLAWAYSSYKDYLEQGEEILREDLTNIFNSFTGDIEAANLHEFLCSIKS